MSPAIRRDFTSYLMEIKEFNKPHIKARADRKARGVNTEFTAILSRRFALCAMRYSVRRTQLSGKRSIYKSKILFVGVLDGPRLSDNRHLNLSGEG